MNNPDNKFNTIDQTLNIGIIQVEPGLNGKVIYLNQIALNILGLNAPEDICGQKFSNLFASSKAAKKFLKEINDLEIVDNELEVALLRKNKDEFLAGLTVGPVRDEKEEVVRFDCTIRAKYKESIDKLANDIVTNVTEIIVANLYMQEVYQRVFDEVFRLVKWERVSVLLRESEKSEICGVIDFAIMTKGLKKGIVDDKFKFQKSHSIYGSILDKIIMTKKYIVIKNTADNTLETDKFFAEDGLMSRFAYPLLVKDKIIGCVAFSANPVNYFNEDHINLIRRIAPLISLTIEYSRMYTKVTKNEKEYNELFKTIDNPWL